MNIVEPRGAVHWIDHFVVGTNNMSAWVDWAVNSTGITRQPIIGLTTAARKRNIKITSFLWWDGGSCRIGAFLQPEILSTGKGAGQGSAALRLLHPARRHRQTSAPARPPQSSAHRSQSAPPPMATTAR